MDKPFISYVPRSDATPEAELSALCNVYRLLLNRANRNAAGITTSNGTMLRYTEEVSDVERRPN